MKSLLCNSLEKLTHGLGSISFSESTVLHQIRQNKDKEIKTEAESMTESTITETGATQNRCKAEFSKRKGTTERKEGKRNKVLF